MAVTGGRTQIREPELGSVPGFHSDAPDFVSPLFCPSLSTLSSRPHSTHSARFDHELWRLGPRVREQGAQTPALPEGSVLFSPASHPFEPSRRADELTSSYPSTPPTLYSLGRITLLLVHVHARRCQHQLGSERAVQAQGGARRRQAVQGRRALPGTFPSSFLAKRSLPSPTD